MREESEARTEPWALFPRAAEDQEGWASGDEVSLEDEKGVCAARRSPLQHMWRPAAKKEECGLRA